MSKLKITLTGLMLPLVLLFGSPRVDSPNSGTGNYHNGENGTLQKMIVASGSATMDLDLSRINGITSTTGRLETAPSGKLSELHFAVAPNSFFPVLVFNNVLRGAQSGSIALVPQNNLSLPPALTASLNRLAIEKIGSE